MNAQEKVKFFEELQMLSNDTIVALLNDNGIALRQELATRGCDEKGKWVGFHAARADLELSCIPARTPKKYW